MKPKSQESPANETRIIDLNLADVKSLIAQVFDEKLNQFAALFTASNPQTGPYWTRKETAEHLSITLPTLRQWTKEGRIKSHEIGRRVLYKPDEVDKALKGQTIRVRK
ncbi:excisionase family DNA-binding protein [Candidatus Nomurabacteria bacterium]|nr:excisionase family DNA-binding protein [Candidatus Nomurabacteria bacterium]